jgi:hypothetical protein
MLANACDQHAYPPFLVRPTGCFLKLRSPREPTIRLAAGKTNHSHRRQRLSRVGDGEPSGEKANHSGPQVVIAFLNDALQHLMVRASRGNQPSLEHPDGDGRLSQSDRTHCEFPVALPLVGIERKPEAGYV